MVIKRYKSSSEVHTGITLPNGTHTRVSFDPMTGGGSTFTTSDPSIQYGLETHPNFGRLFILASVDAPKEAKPAATKKTEQQEPQGLKQVKVAVLADAKDYLVENFELSRTKLRNRDFIVAAAKEHGIEFVGI